MSIKDKVLEYPDTKVNIDIYFDYGDGHWAQEKYCVHGIDDVLWTSNKDNALDYLRFELERIDKIVGEDENS